MAKRPQNFSNKWFQSVLRESDLDHYCRLIAGVLFAAMNADGSNCFPGIDRIAYEADISRDTVKRRLRELRKRGWLDVVLRGGPEFRTARGWQRTNLYVPLIPDVKILTGGAPVPCLSATGGAVPTPQGVQSEPHRGCTPALLPAPYQPLTATRCGSGDYSSPSPPLVGSLAVPADAPTDEGEQPLQPDVPADPKAADLAYRRLDHEHNDVDGALRSLGVDSDLSRWTETDVAKVNAHARMMHADHITNSRL